MRFGTVALLGRTNVGKSTFLNAVLGTPLAIVSPKPQTTRDALLGVVNAPGAQIAVLDTPGLHRPKSELGRRMNAAALDAARAADLVVVMTDVSALTRPKRGPATSSARFARGGAAAPPALDPGDVELLKLLPSSQAALLVINKIDTLRDKTKLLPWMQALSALHEFRAVVPVSVRTGDGTARVLEAISAELPEGGAGYDADMLTNRPSAFFVREYVREQVLLSFEREVPHAVAVSIDAWDEAGRVLKIAATIHVEKLGQRKILVGAGGASIKQIGIGARARIEELLGRQLHLTLFVRVTAAWKDVPRQLAELGYEPAHRSSDARALPDAPRRRGAAGRPPTTRKRR